MQVRRPLPSRAPVPEVCLCVFSPVWGVCEFTKCMHSVYLPHARIHLGTVFFCCKLASSFLKSEWRLPPRNDLFHVNCGTFPCRPFAGEVGFEGSFSD